MSSVITQVDNQSVSRFAGLYWTGADWGPLTDATMYDDEAAAVDAINRLIDAGMPVDQMRIVNWPQFDLT